MKNTQLVKTSMGGGVNAFQFVILTNPLDGIKLLD